MDDVKKTVMIIEDDQFLSSLMKARLEKDGLNVIQEFDGEAAVQAFKEARPDVIVLDLIMPKITGFDVLQTISIIPELSKVPVIILSNLAQDSDIEKARQLGAREYFVKVKVSIDDIVERIKSLLA